MPGVDEWVECPLGIVSEIFAKSGPSQCHEKVTEYFEKRLKEKNNYSLVPSLNNVPVHCLKPNSLVRFRCMIQDMFDPEFFLGAYEVIDFRSHEKKLQPGLYKDLADCKDTEEVDLNSPGNTTMDRLTYYCVSVPGETEWVKDSFLTYESETIEATTSTTPQRQKRSLEDETEDMDTSCSNSSEAETKRTRTDAMQVSAHSSLNIPNLNFPLPNSQGKACLVKLYGGSESLKVNDVVEVIAVLSVEPSLAHVSRFASQRNEGNDAVSIGGLSEFESEELEAHNPPPSLVPRLHAILIKPLDHINPKLPVGLKSSKNQKVIQEIQKEAATTRGELHTILTQALLGDSLSADYLLCHLLSSVYTRCDVMALGKLSLNLTKIPVLEGYKKSLYQLIETLVTKSFYLPMTLQNLNTFTFVPKKDYSQNRLISGILQLSDHTHLVIDETSLSTGQLEAKGVQNITALGNLIKWQRVDYDFSYHKMEFSSNVASLVLSEGRSILPTDIQVPLKPLVRPEDFDEQFGLIKTYLSEGLLEKLRNYITVCKVLEFVMNEDIQKIIQDDFVHMRRENQNMTADDLHSLLVLARYLSLSVGFSTMNKESWEKAKELEKERKRRLQ
ncbi:mini-chromosome maintenance complex-binding protein-like isoform X1 [Limulus polyphemus]|uniref:Mini-chromosome maintenance complex-binding protein n=1 Tax=Limulus polyphemus TaxID=6850 RepID=A0ABM1SRQ3_LIMPO|nr:mini-chromosome maintenance complex-binding protein-like isoform X1 [Limulus polyphemus]